MISCPSRMFESHETNVFCSLVVSPRIPHEAPHRDRCYEDVNIVLFEKFRAHIYVRSRRLMSDYEVTLVNDSMQEFYVRFYGPAESESPIWLAINARHV
jgi:hypothetical protein